MWPVILRELRAGSRRWTTYWLRLLAAAAVVVTIVLWLGRPSSILARQPGREVFMQMHWVILVAIWIIVPLLTADCLSREKREGTLGLLFLTNLRAWNIVFAKAAAIGLIALTLWLSVIPIITVPVLLGGVPASEIIFSCCLSLGSLCCALAAGLIASALARTSAQAVGLAISTTFLGYVVFSLLVVLTEYLSPSLGATFPIGDGFTRTMLAALYSTWNLYTPPRWFGFAVARGTAAPFNMVSLLIPIFCFLASLLVALLAAQIIRRNWQDKPKTKRQTEVEKFFCAPSFFPKLFRRWMRRSLDKNPIGWLEKRSWAGRIMSWIALSVMGSFASLFAYTAASHEDSQIFNSLMWMLLVSIAFVAAGSFRRERETGAMELILVTPLSERQIIFGRLRGLWNQFLPTFLLWAAVVVYLSSALKDWQIVNLVRFTALYLIVPVIGLYFSLRSRFVLLSWVATLAVCFALPQILWLAFREVIIIFEMIGSDGLVNVGLPAQQIMTIPIQLALAALFLWRLRVNLVRRSFSLR